VKNCHELGEHRSSEEHIVCRFKIGYLELHVLGAELFLSSEGHGKRDLADGVAATLGTILCKGAQLKHSTDLESPIWSKVFKNRMFKELPPLMRTRLSLTSLMIGLTIKGYRPSFGMKS
jgi:hypothetical protein